MDTKSERINQAKQEFMQEDEWEFWAFAHALSDKYEIPFGEMVELMKRWMAE